MWSKLRFLISGFWGPRTEKYSKLCFVLNGQRKTQNVLFQILPIEYFATLSENVALQEFNF